MCKVSLDNLNKAASIVYENMAPTPQISWPLLSRRVDAEVWIKHENHTPIGAFKIRGGFVYMAHLRKTHPHLKGVITATRGNHGQSVALAAARQDLPAVIVVPKGNNPEKNAAMRAFGAELIEHGAVFEDSVAHAQEIAAKRDLHMVPAVHPHLVAGVGSYGLELFNAVDGLDTVYAPIGQGSGICGLISVRDALGLPTEIVGVVAERADCYAQSFAAGKGVATTTADTIADGVACTKTNAPALKTILEGAARIIRVSEQEIRTAMGYYLSDTHNLAEGAAAVPLAGLLKERKAQAGKKNGPHPLRRQC